MSADTQDGRHGDTEGQGATVRQGPPGDRDGLALTGDDQPGDEVEGETGGVTEAEDGEDQPDDVGVDAETGRQPAGHGPRQPLARTPAQRPLLAGNPPAGASVVAGGRPLGADGIVGDGSMIAWGHPRDHRVGPRDEGGDIGVASG